jgi:hypothetical protein
VRRNNPKLTVLCVRQHKGRLCSLGIDDFAHSHATIKGELLPKLGECGATRLNKELVITNWNADVVAQLFWSQPG